METRTKFWYDNDGSVGLIKMNDEVFLDTLVPKVYSVHLDEMRGFYLKTEFNQFKLPEKLYGNIQAQADRVTKTYDSRATNTGVLLTGDKGAGKTLLAQAISNNMIKKNNIPVILIGQPFTGVAFQSFVDQIGEAVFMFDEFGKLYFRKNNNELTDNTSAQDGLLTILDGASRAKRMFILTENDVYKINSYLLDRPSRIYYHFKYKKLAEDAIIEFCSDKELKEELSEAIVEIARRMQQFNFDMLQTIVEECLRYDAGPEDVEKLLNDLNIAFDSDEELKIKIINIIDEATDQPLELEKEYYEELLPFPTEGFNRIGAREKCVERDEDGDLMDGDYHSFSKDDIVYRTADRIVFRRGGYTCVTEIVKRDAYAYGYYNRMAHAHDEE